eukprot:TRINITY_DN3807_c0_g1_i1.p1 TRINITY_DN3807_c0_g1~~TRINITY_DN3807_c0_g1_i1.p1  ORF type:complete len:364 (+),score=77.60 TRINITY_DN3807_c0_g1_i1:179-1270(+)
MRNMYVVLIGILGCLYVFGVNGQQLCSNYNDPNYCVSEAGNFQYNYYTCGGVTTADDQFGNRAYKYCQPTSGSVPADGPCAGYNYGAGGICWPNQITGSNVPLTQYTSSSFTTQVNNVRTIYQNCRSGASNPFNNVVPSNELQSNGLGGWSCCDYWYNNQVNINFCNASSCYCPPPCSNPNRNVQLPVVRSVYAAEASNNNKNCYSDCTSCANLFYGARSTSICNQGYTTLPNSGGAVTYPYASDGNCQCCRQFNASSTAPSSAPSNAPGTSSSPSKSDIPSRTPSASPFPTNGTSESDEPRKLSGGAIAGIIIGTLFGALCLIVLIVVVIAIVAFVVVKVIRRSSTSSGVAAANSPSYSTGV